MVVKFTTLCETTFVSVLLCLIAVLAAGCSVSLPQPVQYGVGGAVGGAVVGAGVAKIISRGVVGRSAGLGAAIGFPVGVAYGVIKEEIKEAEEKRRIEQIWARQALIFTRERRIEQFRREIEAERPVIELPYPPERKYLGPTLGNRYR
jgi:hypothetical protein